MTRSKKPVKALNEIVGKYTITPQRTITGGVNGVNFFFNKGEKAELTLAQYQILFNSDYKGEL